MFLPNQFQKEDFRFVLLNARDKRPFQQDWQNTHNYKFDDPTLSEWFSKGNNYGVIGGFGNLLIIDFDDKDFENKITPQLPPTFTIMTGSGGKHQYYITDDPISFKILDQTKKTLADIQGKGKQVVGPGSIHPNGNQYTIINNRDISFLSLKHLKIILNDYLHSKDKYFPKYIDDTVNEIKHRVPLFSLMNNYGYDITSSLTMCRLGHSSKSGKCFSWNDQNGLWYCFHCAEGGDIFTLMMLHDKCDFITAKERLAEMAGLTKKKVEKKEILIKEPIKSEEEQKTDYDDSYDDCDTEKEMMTQKKVNFFEKTIIKSNHWTNKEYVKKIKRFFSDGGNTKLARFLTTKYILKKYNIITDFRTDNIKAYSPDYNYFKDIGPEMIKSFLTKEFNINNTKSNSSEILHLLRTETYIMDEEIKAASPLHLLPFKNGILDLNTMQLLPHDPKYLFDFQIPINYNHLANCPKVDEFFSQVVEEQNKSILYDIFGLALYRVNYLEKFFVLTGNGANGKSRVLILLQKFIGEENQSSITLNQLTEDKFAVARTYKKLVNVGADISGQPIKDTSMLKSASSTDRISGQFKFGQIFDFTPSATLIFSANTPPVFYDDSMGIYRRAELIHFPYTFGNDKDIEENKTYKKADPNVIEKITSEEELSGLLNKALEHLRNILKTGQLSTVKSARELKSDYTKYSNNVQAFVEEYCEETLYTGSDKSGGIFIPAEGFLTISSLYPLYCDYCKIHKLVPKTKDGFSKYMKKMNNWNLEFGQKDYVQGILERSVRGIKFKPSFLEKIDQKPKNDEMELRIGSDSNQAISSNHTNPPFPSFKFSKQKNDENNDKNRLVIIKKGKGGFEGLDEFAGFPKNIDIEEVLDEKDILYYIDQIGKDGLVLIEKMKEDLSIDDVSIEKLKEWGFIFEPRVGYVKKL